MNHQQQNVPNVCLDPFMQSCYLERQVFGENLEWNYWKAGLLKKHAERNLEEALESHRKKRMGILKATGKQTRDELRQSKLASLRKMPTVNL